MSGVLRAAWIIARKDLLVETRSRELVYTTLFFAVSCVLVFAWAFVREGKPIENSSAGVLWVAILFSGTLALGRAFEREPLAEPARERRHAIVRTRVQPGRGKRGDHTRVKIGHRVQPAEEFEVLPRGEVAVEE